MLVTTRNVAPNVQIEAGDETIDVRTEEITGDERDMFYASQASLYRAFAEYQPRTKKVVPVMALTPETVQKQPESAPGFRSRHSAPTQRIPS